MYMMMVVRVMVMYVAMLLAACTQLPIHVFQPSVHGCAFSTDSMVSLSCAGCSVWTSFLLREHGAHLRSWLLDNRYQYEAQTLCPSLMQAAVYGRAFCSVNTVPPDLLLRAAVRLRILNSLRDPNVGVPLTDAQLTALSPAVLVDRLANSRRHLLALRMAAALDLPTNKVSLHARIRPAGTVT